MNKDTVIHLIIAKLTDELELYTRAARAAHAEATDQHNKAENKYDTRGLEASYLARGQAKQVAELEQSLHEFRALLGRNFIPTAPIDVGALVELLAGKDRSFYLIGPRAGGTEVEHEGQEITVMTPQSPLGGQLMGHKAGEKLKLAFGGTSREFKVGSVS
ncbi:MAG TPA: transcription elongation factor GreAB [Candidatus Limnocylindria bacterium]|nr:transcription elongation factor GreAB [Candidatus Limnocylindria bacterium]